MTAVTLCQRSAAYALDALGRVTDADLDRPTPCPGWDVRQLIVHVTQSADQLSGHTGSAAGDPVSAARAAIDRLVATATDDAAYGGAIELVAHGWDLHVALGSGIPVPDEHAAAVLDLATRLVSDEARAAFFAPVVDPGADATASDRLVAFLGRDPSLPAIR